MSRSEHRERQFLRFIRVRLYSMVLYSRFGSLAKSCVERPTGKGEDARNRNKFEVEQDNAVYPVVRSWQRGRNAKTHDQPCPVRLKVNGRVTRSSRSKRCEGMASRDRFATLGSCHACQSWSRTALRVNVTVAYVLLYPTLRI